VSCGARKNNQHKGGSIVAALAISESIQELSPVARFMVIGNTFIMGAYWGAHRGPVVASAPGIHVVVERGAVEDARRSGAPDHVLGWATWSFFGMLAGRMANKQIERSDKVLAPMNLADLPHDIISDPEWPITRRDGLVYFLPKDEVEAIKVTWVGNLYIWFKGLKYTVEVGTFSAAKVRRFLAECGWPV
jgi:hypothetical protein